MSHMVIYRGADGAPGYHQTDQVHDAVAFVENLRNKEGVEEARIFRMEQINFEYRPYFRVELTTGEGALSAAPATPAVEAASASASAPAETASASETSSSSTSEAAAAETEASEGAPVVSSVRSISDSPTISTPSVDGVDNGVGARRGLFGR